MPPSRYGNLATESCSKTSSQARSVRRSRCRPLSSEALIAWPAYADSAAADAASSVQVHDAINRPLVMGSSRGVAGPRIAFRRRRLAGRIEPATLGRARLRAVEDPTAATGGRRPSHRRLQVAKHNAPLADVDGLDVVDRNPGQAAAHQARVNEEHGRAPPWRAGQDSSHAADPAVARMNLVTHGARKIRRLAHADAGTTSASRCGVRTAYSPSSTTFNALVSLAAANVSYAARVSPSSNRC